MTCKFPVHLYWLKLLAGYSISSWPPRTLQVLVGRKENLFFMFSCFVFLDDVAWRNRKWGGGASRSWRANPAVAGVPVGGLGGQHGGSQHVRAAEQLGHIHLTGQTATPWVRWLSYGDDHAEAFTNEQTSNQKLVCRFGDCAYTMSVTLPLLSSLFRTTETVSAGTITAIIASVNMVVSVFTVVLL